MPENKRVFTASRLTSGNLLFPVRIEISPERVIRVKPHLIGSDEESVAISKVASVNKGRRKIGALGKRAY